MPSRNSMIMVRILALVTSGTSASPKASLCSWLWPRAGNWDFLAVPSDNLRGGTAAPAQAEAQPAEAQPAAQPAQAEAQPAAQEEKKDSEEAKAAPEPKSDGEKKSD